MLTGCAVGTSVDNLLKPPQLSVEQEQIYQALQNAVGNNITLQYPRSGDNLSAFIVCDMDDDGEDEAMVFYKKTGLTTAENNLRLNVLDQIDDGWMSVCDRPADGGSYPAIYRQTEGTGIFAAHTYEYRADLGGVQQSGSFTTASGDAIYNSGMEYWSTYTVKGGSLTSAEVSYPNEAASKVFWTSGNNKQTNALCTGQAIEGNNGSLCAALQPKATMGVFAAGNLFTGIFECGSGFSTSGYARFGTQYTYSARPRALRVRVNATVTQVTNAKGPLTTNDIDPARVYVCITNWTDRHTVESGLQYNESTFWDPAKASSLAEGAIIGYGSKTFTESTGGWTTLTLPIYWYDKTAAPAAGRYSLVISCSTSAYGDYTTGSTNNRLYVEDFEWVY